MKRRDGKKSQHRLVGLEPVALFPQRLQRLSRRRRLPIGIERQRVDEILKRPEEIGRVVVKAHLQGLSRRLHRKPGVARLQREHHAQQMLALGAGPHFSEPLVKAPLFPELEKNEPVVELPPHRLRKAHPVKTLHSIARFLRRPARLHEGPDRLKGDAVRPLRRERLDELRLDAGIKAKLSDGKELLFGHDLEHRVEIDHDRPVRRHGAKALRPLRRKARLFLPLFLIEPLTPRGVGLGKRPGHHLLGLHLQEHGGEPFGGKDNPPPAADPVQPDPAVSEKVVLKVLQKPLRMIELDAQRPHDRLQHLGVQGKRR